MQKRIEFSGTEVAYSDRGEGPCLVLLHGYLETGEIWDSFADRFPQGYRLIIPDLPGHGRSGHAESMSYQLLSNYLSKFIDYHNH